MDTDSHGSDLTEAVIGSAFEVANVLGAKESSSGATRRFLRRRVAIIITIMVLDLKPPHESNIAALLVLWPTFLSYAFELLVCRTCSPGVSRRR